MGVGDAAQYTSLRSPGGDFPAVKLLKSIGHSNLQGRSGMGKPKRIGVLTSGGDCAGLNAALRAVVLRAAGHYAWDVIGIGNEIGGASGRESVGQYGWLSWVAGSIKKKIQGKQ